jgi:uncharacterized protein
MIRALIAAVVLAVTASPASAIEDSDYMAAVAAAAQNAITERYRGFTATVHHLPRTLEHLCSEPNEAALKEAQRAFHESALFWASVQFITSGPVSEHQRASRIEYWPDKRNVVGRQLNDVLAKQDPAALEPERFATTSVGVQGLPALERLLFGEEVLDKLAHDEPGREFRCELLATIAQNLLTIANDIVRWTPEQRRFLGEAGAASAEDEAEVTGRDVAGRLLNDLLTAIIAARDMKLLAPLGKSIEKAKPQAAEYWRSRHSLGVLYYNLLSVREIVAADGGLADLLAQQPDGLSTSRALVSALDEAMRMTVDIGKTSQDQEMLQIYSDVSLSEAVVDPDRRKIVEDLAAQLAKVRDLLAGPFATKLNLPIGFNALDGD